MRAHKPDEGAGSLFPPPELKSWQRPKLTGPEIRARLEGPNGPRALEEFSERRPRPPSPKPPPRKRGSVSEWKAQALVTLKAVARTFPDVTVDDVWAKLPEPVQWQRRAMASVMRQAEAEGVIAPTSKTRLAAHRPGFADYRLTVWASLVYR